MRTLATSSQSPSDRLSRSPARVSLREILDVVEQIARESSPRRIILFGSHATGRALRHSDVDLLVVTARPPGDDASLNLRRKVRYGFPLDLIVCDEARLARRIEAGDFFLQDAVAQGKVVYEDADR